MSVATLNLSTIGFTRKSAQSFFDLLKGSNADRLIDIRLNNVSQLAGFAKKDDLIFFLDSLLGWSYEHIPELAPTQDILSAWRKHKGAWEVYEYEFLNLMEQRRIEHFLDRRQLENSCLLCSEHTPEHCHRRLVAEYLQTKWDCEIRVEHLY